VPQRPPGTRCSPRAACPCILREAARALAIYQEHRARDFGAARTLVLEALAEPLAERHRSSAQRRLARLERKLIRKDSGALIPGLDEEPF
jgi:hypothetical protein